MSEKNKAIKGPMCKLRKKVLQDDPESYIKLLKEPHFLCKKCGRVANNKKNICKPLKLRS
jgi:hypothetical protein